MSGDVYRTIGALAQAAQLPTPRLVIVEREARCSVCGRRIVGEARAWFGASFVHDTCASELAGPGGK